MKVRLVAFGIAKEILGSRNLPFEFEGLTVGQLKDQLVETFPEFARLRSLSFAVQENYREDHFGLNENDEVVIIPPVSGG
ncbi:MAG: MoaD/ThiS family protein [Bacteroidetes bacterium]|nr:MoaD/ThiS family protein [Bacteroidota bacterium]